MKHGTEKETFDTGAKRDTHADKLRYDLITPWGLTRLAKVYTDGAKHYGDRNWEKGMPISRCLASVERHLMGFKMRDTSEDHLAQMVWNGMAILHYQEMMAQGLLPRTLDDLPTYESPHHPFQREAPVSYREATADQWGKVNPNPKPAPQPTPLTFGETNGIYGSICPPGCPDCESRKARRAAPGMYEATAGAPREISPGNVKYQPYPKTPAPVEAGRSYIDTAAGLVEITGHPDEKYNGEWVNKTKNLVSYVAINDGKSVWFKRDGTTDSYDEIGYERHTIDNGFWVRRTKFAENQTNDHIDVHQQTRDTEHQKWLDEQRKAYEEDQKHRAERDQKAARGWRVAYWITVLKNMGCPQSVAESILGGTTFTPAETRDCKSKWAYVAGPMRNHPKFNFPAFDRCRDELVKKGYNVISPADIDRFTNPVADDPSKVDVTDQTAFVLRDFWSLFFIRKMDLINKTNHNAIALLRGWPRSTGATGEFFLSRWLVLNVLDHMGNKHTDPFPEFINSHD